MAGGDERRRPACRREPAQGASRVRWSQGRCIPRAPSGLEPPLWAQLGSRERANWPAACRATSNRPAGRRGPKASRHPRCLPFQPILWLHRLCGAITSSGEGPGSERASRIAWCLCGKLRRPCRSQVAPHRETDMGQAPPACRRACHGCGCWAPGGRGRRVTLGSTPSSAGPCDLLHGSGWRGTADNRRLWVPATTSRCTASMAQPQPRGAIMDLQEVSGSSRRLQQPRQQQIGRAWSGG